MPDDFVLVDKNVTAEYVAVFAAQFRLELNVLPAAPLAVDQDALDW